jgi:hypothetical protein
MKNRERIFATIGAKNEAYLLLQQTRVKGLFLSELKFQSVAPDCSGNPLN